MLRGSNGIETKPMRRGVFGRLVGATDDDTGLVGAGVALVRLRVSDWNTFSDRVFTTDVDGEDDSVTKSPPIPAGLAKSFFGNVDFSSITLVLRLNELSFLIVPVGPNADRSVDVVALASLASFALAF